MRGLKLLSLVLLGVLFLVLAPATYAAGYGNPQEIGPYHKSAWENAWADYNGDGHLDFIQAQTNSHTGGNHKNSLYLGDGYGGFTWQELSWSHQSYSVAAADFDKDGDKDIAVGNFDQNYLYINDGSGNFTRVAEFGSGKTLKVAWGDCNGDGYPDLAVANRGPSNHSGEQNYLYVNNGNGTFTQHAEFGNGATYSITWGDFDGDGDLDAAVANYGQNYLYINDGACNFTPRDEFGNDHTLDIAWGDFDGNGDLDAAVMNGIWPSEGSYSTDIQNYLYVNNGDGTFTPRSEFGTRNSVSASWGDVDGDGDLDLAVANVKDTQPNTLYINNSGTFTEDTTAFPGNYWTARGDFVDIGGNGTLEYAISQFCDESGCPAAVWWNGAIGDYVWYDSNSNGIQDSGEHGKQDVSVTLHRSDDSVVATHYTDKKGHYLFADIPAGSYYLVFGNLPSNHHFTPANQGGDDSKDSDAAQVTGRTAAFSLAQGQQDYTWDAGIKCSSLLASVGDWVWDDVNQNGIQDSGEVGIPGVTVELYKSDDTLVATTTTDANGVYHFYNLQMDHYYVKFILPNGYMFSPKDRGNEAKDSDADPATGKTNTFCLSGGCNCNKEDAGMYQFSPASLGDFVWNDSNADGIQDAGESGISGVTVELYSGDSCSGSAVSLTTTDGSGNYSFSNLTPGTYSVKFVKPSGYVFSPQNAGADAVDSDADTTSGCTGGIALSSGDNTTTWDAGMYSANQCIQRVTIYATHTAWVDSHCPNTSHYDQSELHVRAKPDGKVRRAYDYFDLSALPAGAVLSAQLKIDPNGGEAGMMGAHSTAWDGTSITWDTAPGVDSLLDSEYYDGGTDTQSFNVASAVSGHPNDVSFVLKFNDESPSTEEHDDHTNPRLVVTLNICADLSITKTDAPDPVVVGNQLTYTLAVVNNGPAAAQNVVVMDTVPSELQSPQYSTDGGSNWHAWTGSLSLGSMAASASQTVLLRGTVDPTTTVSSISNTATVESDTQDSDTSNNSDTEDTTVNRLASIGDFVWHDANANGIQDGGESGISGVTVALYSGDSCSGSPMASTTTGGSGDYSFTNLTPGTYSVKFTLPSGYVFSPANQGGDDSVDSDVNTSSGCTGGITLTAGQYDMTWDAGMYQTASIGDFVWHDLYHSQTHQVDGIQDSGEIGIAGVVMELYDSSSTLVATATTDTNGHYLFSDVVPGTYTVKVADSNFTSGSVLEGWYASPQNAGSNDAVDSDGDESSHEATVTLTSGENDQDMDFGFYHTGVSLEKTGPQSVTAGDVITYHFRVENTGDLVLHGEAHVYDPLLKPSGDHEIWHHVVWPGEVYEFDKTYTSDQSQCGALTNTATVVGHPRKGDGTYVDDVTDQASWTVQVLCYGSIGDFVWNDTNADGIQDGGESGISGVTVALYSGDSCSGSPMASTTTGGSGDYSFTNLTPGTYSVKFTLPSGYVFSPANQGGDDSVDSDANTSSGCTGGISLSAGENDTTWDAGMYQAPIVAVDKSVPQQDNVVNGIVLVGNIVNFQVVVTNNGQTTLSYIPLHDQFDNTCLRYEPKSANPQENNHSGDSIDWVDLTVNFSHDLQPGQAFTVTIPFQTEAEDNNAVNTAVVHNAEDINSQIAPDAQDQASVICKLPASIGDRVWNDTNNNGTQDSGEAGINSVTVNLYKDNGNSTFEPDSGDTLVATQVTSGDGNYDFTMLYAGSYWVDVDESTLATGYNLTTANEPLLVTVNYGDDYNGADFGYAGKGNIAGTVWYDWNSDGAQQPNEDGIPNVEVCLYQDNNGNGQLDGGDTKLTCQNTASDGTYIFHDQMPGDYLVVETQPSGMDSTTPNVVVVHLVITGPSGSDVDNNFGDIQYASVGDFVYADSNGDGEQQSGETQGVPGATLHLTGTDINGASVDRSTTSNGSGNYSFTDLLPGDYQVEATPPAGYVVTTVPNPQSFHLNAGDAKDDVDFGLISPTGLQIVFLRGEATGHTVTLRWATMNEEGVVSFRVERHCSQGWSSVGEVAAVGLGGNSYSFSEENVPAGEQLYRLVSEPGGTSFGPVEVTVYDPGHGDSQKLYLPFVGG